jgi:hypothetical protein
VSVRLLQHACTPISILPVDRQRTAPTILLFCYNLELTTYLHSFFPTMDLTLEPKTTVQTRISAGFDSAESFSDPKLSDTKEALAGPTVIDYPTGWSLRFLTGALMLGMFLVGVDSSIIGVVTPKITTSFQAMDDIAWYGSGYMLPHTVLQPTFGSFYKMFNVKAVYLTSIAVFESKSLLLWEVQRWLTRRQLAHVFALRRRTRFASSSVV